MAYDNDFLVRPIMSAASGLPEDKLVNDWAFKWVGGGDPVETNFVDLCAAVGGFYRNGAGAPDQVGNYIGSAVNRSATHEIQVYEISVGAMGSPVYSEDWLGPVSPGTTVNLPTECAAVLSFHADLSGIAEESGVSRPRARRRGRVYIGPLTTGALQNGGNTGAGANPAPRLATAFLDAMRTQAVAMAAAAELDGWRWSVWSRSDVTLRDVVAGWTDDAPDTQRRRGQAAAARVVYFV